MAGRFLSRTFPRFAPCAVLQSRIERPLAGFRRNLRRLRFAFGRGGVAAASVASAAEPRYRGDPVMGVSYAYNLASTLYNDAEQRPEMVKQGLTRAGIEKV